ncbi:hypothetical protein GE09DRAFT_1225744 [Coniochaeta sp. 2T2.1]|nr:hypothetical protein GE09DRAFT_1225744 [Coniochaeta sp. 2T2.1]
MATVPKLEFRIRDIPTRTVTLFPTRAQVVRDIKNVVLKPGANEITILGLSPSVDEDSIKVEGTGSAIISDISVELLPNREIFEEIYPDDDDDESEELDDDEPDHDQKKESEAMASLNDKLTSLEDEQKRVKEIIASAESQVKILDSYGTSIKRENTDDIRADLKDYRNEREKAFKDHLDAAVEDRELSKKIADLKLERARLARIEQKKQKQLDKEKVKAAKAKQKEAEKKARRKMEERKEKGRIRKEREDLWPVMCWSVRITLDAIDLQTPGSSRRTSIASASDLVKVDTSSEHSDGTYKCDLSLSYVVSSAYWSPSYDLSLSTTTNTALLCFDAQLTNKTSENWNNCKIVLSTSQATFAGLQDDIPTLVPWRVRLNGKGYGGRPVSEILDSREERNHKDGQTSQQGAWNVQKSRSHLYGYQKVNNAPETTQSVYAAAARPTSVEQQWAQIKQAQGISGSPFGAHPAGLVHPAPVTSGFGAQPNLAPTGSAGLFGGATRSSAGGLFGGGGASNHAQSASSDARSTAPTGLLGAAGSAPRAAALEAQTESVAPEATRGSGSILKRLGRKSSTAEATLVSGDNNGTFDFDSFIAQEDAAPAPSLSFQESSHEETGLTTTYDLPGLKSLPSSSTPSKQRVARVSFTSVSFSHTVVAKYKPAAYLKAKLRNGSKITLLKGPVGLTLDGSFMGRSTLPRCSAGDSFTLSLGVDPAIHVVYSKPEVRRSTSGMIFSKEDSSVYTRTTTISNTRAAAAAAGKSGVRLVVQDQVPVSEDERLRVAIHCPRGLVVGSNPVPAGTPGKPEEDKDWGQGKASLKKGGEVEWDVELAAGKSVRLVLEYEVAAPGGEGVVQV